MATVALFISRLIGLYLMLIWIRIIFSWFSPYPRPGSFTYFLSMLVDPYLDMFRTKFLRMGFFDFSPLIGIGVLEVVRSIFTIYGTYGVMRLSFIVQLFIEMFWSYGISLFFIMLGLFLLLRTIGSFMPGTRFQMNMNALTGSIENMERRFFRMLFPNRIVRDSTMNVVFCFLTVGLYILCRYLFLLLLQFASRIPL